MMWNRAKFLQLRYIAYWKTNIWIVNLDIFNIFHYSQYILHDYISLDGYDVFQVLNIFKHQMLPSVEVGSNLNIWHLYSLFIAKMTFLLFFKILTPFRNLNSALFPWNILGYVQISLIPWSITQNLSAFSAVSKDKSILKSK